MSVSNRRGVRFFDLSVRHGFYNYGRRSTTMLSSLTPTSMPLCLRFSKSPTSMPLNLQSTTVSVLQRLAAVTAGIG
ncbi:hypothetical protein PIB30_036675 [Stylosanthes scabra]|uniref:Uncharacterized protein n=1 Tax=Stylosanthes scabra TaxID=79078 RepID=A0ABU6XB32_9FABA|nr:hypothetical protein [Stylosanthes scabra]